MKTDWPTKKLGEVTLTTDFVANGSFASLKENVNYLEAGYAALIRTTDLQSNFTRKRVYVDQHAYNYLSKSKLLGGEIVLASVGSIGSVFLCPTLEIPMTLGPNAVLVRPEESVVDNHFLYYYFLSPSGQEMLRKISSATTQPKFNKTNLRNQEIPLPSLEEQKKIVKVLEEKLGKVKEAVKLREEAITHTEKILSTHLTGIFENSENEDWCTEPLLEVAASIADGTHDTPRYVQKGIPLITSKNLKPEGIDFTNVKYISAEDHDQISKRSGVKKGDLLIAMIGTIGNITIVESDSIFSIKNVGLVRPDESKVLAKYIYYYLHNSRLFSLFELRGATQKFISLGSIRSLLISFPDLKTQQQIVKELDELYLKVSELRKLQELQLSDLKDLEQAYLREAFNGDLI